MICFLETACILRKHHVSFDGCSTEMDAFTEASAMQWVILSAPTLIMGLQSSTGKTQLVFRRTSLHKHVRKTQFYLKPFFGRKLQYVLCVFILEHDKTCFGF
ncbi:hypothetical protein CDAR_102061 [Caerostris darwini]|uniref:Uncharacterized protein n=1 Tax=Caerostris darwini TaxID=1538125 RepID=A0AAV4MGY2_9ARAC|nr:hypothetical protein CDAR_102061 [Caerostris darwini]